MPGFLDTLKRLHAASKQGGETIRDSLKDLAGLPTKTGSLEEEVGELRGKMESLEEELERAKASEDLLRARSRTVVMLHHALLKRTDEENAQECSSFESALSDLTKQLELVNTLHRETSAKLDDKAREFADITKDLLAHKDEALKSREMLEQQKSEKRERLDTLTVEKQKGAKKLEVLQGKLEATTGSLEKLERKKEEAEGAYKALLGDVKRSIRQLLVKLIEKGYSTDNIMELVPELNQIYPQKKIVELEQEIRSHNAEVEALMDLQELRSSTLTPTSEEQEILRQPLPGTDFFSAIFEP